MACDTDDAARNAAIEGERRRHPELTPEQARHAGLGRLWGAKLAAQVLRYVDTGAVRGGTGMRTTLRLGAAASVMLLGSQALAQDPAAIPVPTPAPAASSAPAAPATPAPASPPPVATAPVDDSDAPPPGDRPPPGARTGFQLALRTGFQVPFGQVAANANMGDTFSGQVPIGLDIGWKFIPELFVGLYGSLGFGGTSGATAGACAALDVACVTATLRLGLEAIYYLAPSAKVDPWLGYGIGIESTGFSASNGNQTVSAAAAGWEFAHFMVGVDFRLTKYIGLGPLVDFSLGQYSSESTKDASGNTTNGSIAQQALHEWLLVGGRVLFYP